MPGEDRIAQSRHRAVGTVAFECLGEGSGGPVMNERARRTKRFVSPDRLHKDLENAWAASPSIPFPDPQKSRASRLGSRLLVLFQIVVFIGAVMIPLAAVAADPAAAPDPAPAEAAAAPDPTPEPTPDPTPEPTPEPTPAPTPDPTPVPTAAPTAAPRSRLLPRRRPIPARQSPSRHQPASPAPKHQAIRRPSPPAIPPPVPSRSRRRFRRAQPCVRAVRPTDDLQRPGRLPPWRDVTLTGANWAAGEAVHIFVNDTIGHTWRRDVDVIASDPGPDRRRLRAAELLHLELQRHGDRPHLGHGDDGLHGPVDRHVRPVLQR